MKRRDFIASSGALIGSSTLGASTEQKPSGANAPSLRGSLRKKQVTTTAKRPKVSWPALSLDDLHTLMEVTCKDAHTHEPQIGAFFQTAWLVNNLRTQFHDAATAIANLGYQSPFKNVSAGLTVDLTNTDLEIDDNGKIWLTNFRPLIILKDPQARIYDQIAIQFDPVLLRMDVDITNPGKIRFYITTNDPNDPAFPTYTQGSIGANPPTNPLPDPTVLGANGYTPQTFQQVEMAIEASEAAIDILDTFISSLPLVGILDAMRQFAIGVPLSFNFYQGYVIVHGPSASATANPCGPMAGTTVSSTIVPSPKPPSPTPTPNNGFTFTFKHSISAPATVGGSPIPPMGFYYPIALTFGPFVNGVLGPGVVASDSGDAFLFHWAYQLSARPKIQPIKIVVPSDPNGTGTYLAQMQIDAPLDVGGGAGVSMKIGCVTVPLVSTTILGKVDPSRLTLTLRLVDGADGAEVVLTPDYDCAIDVTFYSPPLIDILLNIVMGSIGDRLVGGALRDMVNKLSFPLLKLHGLEYQSGQGFRWAIGQNFRSNSLLLAVNERKP